MGWHHPGDARKRISWLIAYFVNFGGGEMPENNQGGTPNNNQQQQGGTPNNNQPGGTPGENNQELSFDTWIATQDETIQTMLNNHTSGLKSALQSERDNGSKLQGELKKLARELEAGTEARTKLEGITDRLEEMELRNAAYETFGAAGITNFKLAWMAAQDSKAIDGRGNVNLESLKAQYPELFPTKTPPPGNAGSGTNNGAPAGGGSMDEYIRTAAGRR